MDNALKALSRTDAEIRVANYIVLFGGRDLEGIVPYKSKIYRPNPDGSRGEFFTPNTIFDSPYTKAGGIMVDFEHGFGRRMFGVGPGPEDILGYVDWKTAQKDERGIFVERVLDLHNAYVQWVAELIDLGIMGTSTRATPGVQKTANGAITRWPLRLDTIAVDPMEPRMKAEFGDNVLQAFKALGIPVPEHTPDPKPETGAEPEAGTPAVSVVKARARVKLELYLNNYKES